MSQDRPKPVAADPGSGRARTSGRQLDLLRTPIEDGITLIEASAGTGKTYCLTGLVLRLLLERKVEHVGELLVVTFTNAATEELGGRIRRGLREALAAMQTQTGSAQTGGAQTGGALIEGTQAEGDPDPGATEDLFAYLARTHAEDGPEILRRALLDFDDLTVATIHGFCKQALDESAFESGLPFELELLESDEDLLAEAARDVWRRLLDRPETRRPIVAEAVTESRLGPESFVSGYRDWLRYPDTRILPEPLTLGEATEALERARQKLAGEFDRSRARLLLRDVQWKAKSTSQKHLGDADDLKTVLTALDTFCQGGTGLWAAQVLDPDRLLAEVYKKHREAVGQLPGFESLVELHQALGHFEHALFASFVRQLDQVFPRAKHRSASLAFDDLLHRLRDALADPRRGPRLARAIRGRYSVALIDEFQDTDLVQFEIFERLFAEGPLFLVGDPKQAIYRFRGADIHAYLEAKRGAHRTYTLGLNWRSGQRLVAAVNAVFERGERPFLFGEIPFSPVAAAPPVAERRVEGDGRAALSWLWVGQERSAARAEAKIAELVAAEMAILLDGAAELVDGDGGRRTLVAGDLAVLVRTNQQAMRMQEALRRVGVPAVIGRSGDIFHSQEMADLLTVLRALLDPGRGGRLRAACTTVLWGDDAAEIDALGLDDARFQERVDTFELYRDEWAERGFVAMTERLVSERQVRQRLLSLEQGERRATNLFHAVEVCHRAIHDHNLSPAGLVAWLDAEILRDRHDRDAAELRLESDALAVDLATVHKAKGLEYEVVFCPFLWKARPVTETPVLAHLGAEQVVFDRGSAESKRHLALAEAERLAEDLRLAYVALTRARRRCYVVWGQIGSRGGAAASALAYLLHRAPGLGAEPATSEEGVDDLAALAERALASAKGRTNQWLEDLRTFVDAHGDSMGLVELAGAEALPAVLAASAGNAGAGADAGAGAGPGREPRLLANRLPAAAWQQLRPWRVSSYSSLVRDGEREQPDHGDPATAVPESVEVPGEDGHAAAPSGASVVPKAAPDPEPTGIFAFARGARAGDCLHQIFESIDFPQARDESTRTVIEEKLRQFHLLRIENHARGADAATFDPVRDAWAMVRHVLGARLPGERFALEAVDRPHRLVEWQFYAPLGLVDVAALARELRQHGQEPWTERYADRLARLSPQQATGFLTGYVDLVFEHAGRWFVVDWKSNHLGNRHADYDGEAMTHAMVEHHYLLQYHLYVAALHRFLAARLPDWSYERDFGGVFYVFLRGVEPPRSELARSAPGASATRKRRPAVQRHHEGQLSLFADQAETPAGRPQSASPELEDGPVEGVRGIFRDRPAWPLVRAFERALFGPDSAPGARATPLDGGGSPEARPPAEGDAS